jgi:hypothetical protein
VRILLVAVVVAAMSCARHEPTPDRPTVTAEPPATTTEAPPPIESAPEPSAPPPASASAGIQNAPPDPAPDNYDGKGTGWWMRRNPCPGTALLKGVAGVGIGCELPNGKLHGKQTRWYPNGRKLKEAEFKDGVEVPGSNHAWNEDGSPDPTEKFWGK